MQHFYTIQKIFSVKGYESKFLKLLMMIEKQHEFALTTSREYMKIQEIEPP